MRVVMLCSGGMDSVVLAHYLAHRGDDLSLIAVDYGQRHRRELDYARACAERLGARIDIVDLSSLRPLLTGSALTDDVEVPDGHYADDSMKLTIVPNRNAILLSVAYAAAVSREAQAVAYAAHSGDHPIYPDCRPDFVAALEQALCRGNDVDIIIETPFMYWDKATICLRGSQLGVPFEQTWSCYRGGEHHCGTCGTCTERREAFVLAGVTDPTEYVA